MKLRELFESQGSVGIIFGRFNPPHQGHKAAWEMAAQNDAWYVGTNEGTVGPKDPLPYKIKLQAMAAIMPEIKGHVVPEQSWLTLASKVYKKYGDVALNVYTDEDWVTKTLVAYNGKDGAHGFYRFSHLKQVPTPRLSSATALRAAVQAGDREAFAQAAGVDADTPVAGHAFFDVVAKYLLPYQDAPKRVKKKKEIAELSSELLGRYKKAAGADASRADKEGDIDRGNKRFKGIVKATKKQFDNDSKGVFEGSGGKVGKGGTKPIDKEKKAAMRNAMTLPGLNMSTGSAYKNYRMGIALAGAPDYPTKTEADNWIGGDPLLSAYTDEEFEMIKKAALQVGAGTIQNWSGNRSQEVADVNKTSPVAKVKRNKYGV
jgi:hypothetical protein